MAKKILIAGASGLIGTRLTELLLQKGFAVSHLSRGHRLGVVPSYVWNVEKGAMDPQALVGIESIINLAGAGVADKRWTTIRKKEILDSRIRSTALLCRALEKGNHRIKSFISASAIGYYGRDTGEAWVTESSRAGNDFLAQVVAQWEEECEKINSLGVRVAKLRIGIVLSEKGGALKAMATPIKYGLGAALGNGKQYMSWIHIDDLCSMFIKAAEDDHMQGVYNAAGNQPVTNMELTKTIAKVLKKSLWLPAVPGFVLKLVLGEMAGMVIGGNKVLPARIQATGFQYQFTDLEAALRNLYPV